MAWCDCPLCGGHTRYHDETDAWSCADCGEVYEGWDAVGGWDPLPIPVDHPQPPRTRLPADLRVDVGASWPM